MKTIFFTFMILILSSSGWAQKGLFEDLTSKYSDKDGFSASRITRDMFDLYLKKRNVEENSPVYEALKTLDNILVVSQSGYFNRGMVQADTPNEQNVNEMYQDILKYYESNNYSLFKTERQMGEDVKVYLKKNGGKIGALALVTHSGRATNLVELQGENIDLTTVSELNKALNLRGLENLYKINSPGTGVFYMRVPPDVPSEEQIRGMVEKHRDLIEKQNHLTEEQRRKIETQARIMAERQVEMAEKYREMADKYRRQPIFLSVPGDSVDYFIDGQKVDADAMKKISPNDIERVEVNKGKDVNERRTIRITTRKKE